MGYTKKTTRSTGKGSRTTATRTITNKGSTKQTTSHSVGGKVNRYTASTSVNSGRTKQYVTTNVAGWRKTILLNPVSKTKKVKMQYLKKSKTKSLGFFGWTVIIIIAILLINS